MPYAVFVAPALLASSAMNGAIFDSTFNVFFKLKYARLYDSVLATPLGPARHRRGRDLRWSLLRGTLYSAAFLLVAWLAGTVQSWWALLALPAATFIGFAFSAVGMFAHDVHAVVGRLRLRHPGDPADVPVLGDVLPAVDLSRRRCSGWSSSRRSTTGVALERGLMLGEVGPGLLVHVLYLAVLGLVGFVGTARRIERLLLS